MTTSAALIPELDLEYLEAKGYRYGLQAEGGWINVVIHDFALPVRYAPVRAELLVRLPAAYPNTNPDMFWTRPDVMLAGGGWPRAATCHETYGGLGWQRWSRHFPAGSWRPGVDCLETYLASIRRELHKGI